MSKSFLKNILNVISSNILSFIASVVTGLVVPVLLGATDYGYYRMFILYSTYTSLLHFGFVDGVLLKISGKRYNELNKIKFRSNSLSFMLLEFVVSIIVMGISFFVQNRVYSFLCIVVGINTFISNVITYYQFVAQATMNFKGYSIRSAVQSLLAIILTMLLWLFYKVKIISQINYQSYIFISLFIVLVMLIMCIDSYRDITFGSRDSLILGFQRLIQFCKHGIYLTIAYQISSLIMIIDNQFVSTFFKVSTYGKYSFAYSITNTALMVLSAVATVLLPHLKRNTFKHIINEYHKMIASMMLIVYLALLAYFPLCVLIKIILPGYVQSLSYLKIFLPELGITCSVTIITFNYYNALGKSKFYFYVSLIILFISAIIDSGMYLLFHDPVLVALGSFISIFIWYLVSEHFLIKWYNVKWIKNLIYMSLMISAFFLTTIGSNLIIGFCSYLAIYLLLSIIIFKKIVFNMYKLVLKKVKLMI